MGTDTNRVQEPPVNERVAVASGLAVTRKLSLKRDGEEEPIGSKPARLTLTRSEPYRLRGEQLGANIRQGSEEVRAEKDRLRVTCQMGGGSQGDLRVTTPAREPSRREVPEKPCGPRSAVERVRVGTKMPKGRRAR